MSYILSTFLPFSHDNARSPYAGYDSLRFHAKNDRTALEYEAHMPHWLFLHLGPGVFLGGARKSDETALARMNFKNFILSKIRSPYAGYDSLRFHAKNGRTALEYEAHRVMPTLSFSGGF